MEPRDPMVDRETGGGWSSLLPNRNAVVALALIGGTSYFSQGTKLGDWLSAPPLKQVPKEQQLDDAGTPFGPDTQASLTGGFGVLIAYNFFSVVARPRFAAYMREKREQEASESAEAPNAPADTDAAGVSAPQRDEDSE